MGDLTDFVQEEPMGLGCLTKIFATCDVEDVFMFLGTPTSDF